MPLKLLDYGRPNPFGEIIGKPRNLAWPVNVYRVTLPKVSEDAGGLNPFERVILKMIDADGMRETAALARETCLPVDLVQCVLLRLRDKAFIDDHNGIIEQRRHKWADPGEPPAHFVTALLFRELAAGKILPFLHLLSDTNPLKKKEEPKKVFKAVRGDNQFKDNPPTPRDVITALRTMRNRSTAFGKETRLPAIQQITIASEPELFYLDCPIAIQKSDVEFRIADPFGNGFSLILENAFNRLREQVDELGSWLLKWRQDLTNPETVKQDEIVKEPYNNNANQGRYPNLLSCLRLKKNTPYRSIKQIHDALEWALFYACARFPYDTVIHRLKLANQSEHPALLKQAAENIGLNLPPSGLRPVPLGKLDDFLSDKAEMGTVLSLSLLLAENDVRHPLHRIVARHPDFIVRLFEIKKKRDDQAHGKGRVQRNGILLPDEIFMREIVTTLLPAMVFSDTPVAEMDKDAAADSLLEARTGIQGEFGFRLFNRLGPNLQDDLIHAEEFWLSCQEGDNACAFVVDVCAALQRAFSSKLSGVLPPDIKNSEFFMVAQDNATKAGLGQLPECLRMVKSSAVQKTLQGDNQTLGACVVSFLIVTEEDALRVFANCLPSFLADIKNLIQKRGHGNRPLPLSKKDVAIVRKQAFSIIKSLLEV